MVLRLVKLMAEAEGIAEELKATDPMAWVSKMNGRAARLANTALIYSFQTAAPVSIRGAMDPPKVFWMYYDLYRRKRMSLSEYAAATGLSAFEIRHYLMDIVEKESKCAFVNDVRPKSQEKKFCQNRMHCGGERREGEP